MKKLLLILLCLPMIGFGQIMGCTDSTAFNYNYLATMDDGMCLYSPFVFGCTDASAINYDALATFDDGSCCSYIIVSNYYNWDAADPNNSGGTNIPCNYTQMQSNGTWHDWANDTALSPYYILEKDTLLSSLFANNYSLLGIHNSNYYYLSNSVTNWTSADSICNAHDGYLTIIEDVYENNFINQEIININGNGAWYAWIGLYQDTSSSLYGEPSNGILGNIPVCNFDISNPNNYITCGWQWASNTSFCFDL